MSEAQSTTPVPPQVTSAMPQPSAARELGKAASVIPRWFWIAGACCVLLVGTIFAIVIGLNVLTSPASKSVLEAVAPLPEVPIGVTLRKALMGDGYVVTFRNDGEQQLLIDVTHKRPTLNQATPFQLRINAGMGTEVGWNEGHTFYPGDQVVISHSGYRSKTWTLNP